MAVESIQRTSFGIAEIAVVLKRHKSAVEKRAARESWAYCEETTRGGRRRLYSLSALPEDVQAVVLLAQKPAIEKPSKAIRTAANVRAMWARYEQASDAMKLMAERRLAALQAVAALTGNGRTLQEARAIVASQLQREGVRGGSVPSLVRWSGAVDGLEVKDWIAALLPDYVGRTKKAECDPQCWDWYCAHYLDQSRPSHKETYRRLCEMASAQGWTVPSARTLERRMDAEVSGVTQTLRRYGVSAARGLLPTQDRDALSFATGEAVNGDGLKFDRLWVRFEDGEVINTATGWFWQDIHSRKILAWRLSKTENTDLFRLATYDLTGVCAPTDVWMDNTRVAANKVMTAGTSHRHRFKQTPEDGLGLLRMLGMNPHFTNPDKETGSPGSKPIERAFGIGGLHSSVATNPQIVAAGGYSKATAIDVALLREVIADEVTRHNARTKRNTQACRGVLSFDQAWEAGQQQRPPRVLSDAQRRLLLMSREMVVADKRNGELRIEAGRGRFAKNAYWCEHLPEYRGQKLAVHFDPENLSSGVHVYSLSGRYLFLADHIPRGAFNDTDAGREHSKLRRRVRKLQKGMAENETRMNSLEVATLYGAAVERAPVPPAAQPDSNVVAGHFVRVPDPQRDAQQRTGTDDVREVQFADHMERLLAKRAADKGWGTPNEEAP